MPKALAIGVLFVASSAAASQTPSIDCTALGGSPASGGGCVFPKTGTVPGRLGGGPDSPRARRLVRPSIEEAAVARREVTGPETNNFEKVSERYRDHYNEGKLGDPPGFGIDTEGTEGRIEVPDGSLGPEPTDKERESMEREAARPDPESAREADRALPEKESAGDVDRASDRERGNDSGPNS